MTRESRRDANEQLSAHKGADNLQPLGEVEAPWPLPRTHSKLGSLFAATRPRQWIKNLLVFAAPAAGGLLGHRSALEKTTLAAGLFLVASWGTYLLNDALDVSSDRIHPQKRNRPVASGDLSPALALRLGLVSLLLSVSAAGYFLTTSFLAVLGSYAAVNISYSLYLKRIPVIELACVTSGFVFPRGRWGRSSSDPDLSLVRDRHLCLLVACSHRETQRRAHDAR